MKKLMVVCLLLGTMRLAQADSVGLGEQNIRQVLRAVGLLDANDQPAIGTAHALLDANNDNDTTASPPTRGAIIYGNATPKWSSLPLGAANTFVHSSGTDLSFTLLTTSDIPSLDTSKLTTGTLPLTRGGTGVDASVTAPTFAGLTLTGDLLPTVDATQNLGSPTRRWIIRGQTITSGAFLEEEHFPEETLPSQERIKALITALDAKGVGNIPEVRHLALIAMTSARAVIDLDTRLRRLEK